VCSVYDSVDR